MIDDKRKLKRCDIFLIAEFKPLNSPGVYSIGITRDLSPDGFSLEAQAIDCKSGDIMEFRLRHPDAECGVTVSGKVIWKNHSWYKYTMGIKFLDVSEVQNAKIHKLMSALRGEADKPELTGNGPGGAEKEKVPAVISVAVAADNSLPDTGITNSAGISLKEAEHCELTDPERIFIRDAFVINSDEAADKIKPAVDTADIEEADRENKKICTAHVDTDFRGKKAQITFNNINPAGNIPKKRIWLYIPFAAVVVIILVIALPVMIKKFNDSPINAQPELTEPAGFQYTGKDEAGPAGNNTETGVPSLNKPSETPPVQTIKEKIEMNGQRSSEPSGPHVKKTEDKIQISGQGLNESSGPPPVKKAGGKPEVNFEKVRRPELAVKTDELRYDSEGKQKIDVIKKIDETLRTIHSTQNERPAENKVLIEIEKKPRDNPLPKTEEQPANSQVVRTEDTPPVIAIKEIEQPAGDKQEVKASPEEKKEEIKKTVQPASRPKLPGVALLIKRAKSPDSPSAPGAAGPDPLKK